MKDELKLHRDLARAADAMGDDEARYLVDAYYMIQEKRKAAENQARALVEAGEPAELVSWIAKGQRYFEAQVRRALARYTDQRHMGRWARGIVGIGPVLSAGLLAHIDITRAPTAGHIWSFAGLVPGQRWERGQRRPWNAALKVLCWKIGESFVKVSGRPDSLYGRLYLERKAYESARNAAGDYADLAAGRAAKVGRNTEAFKHYSAGHLPPGHVHARAKRWAVKLFIAHWHEEAYRHRYGAEPPMPYPIQHLGHVDWIRSGQAS